MYFAPDCLGSRLIFRSGVRGYGNEVRMRELNIGSQAPADLVSIHPRHADVENHNVGQELAGEREGDMPVDRVLDLMSLEPEQPDEAPSGIDVVFHHQDAASWHRRSLPTSLGLALGACPKLTNATCRFPATGVSHGSQRHDHRVPVRPPFGGVPIVVLCVAKGDHFPIRIGT